MNLSDQWRVFTGSLVSAPVPVEGIPQKLGIGFNTAYLSQEISGMLERLESGFVITVNALDPLTRRRFTLAHELGHYMLHRHLIGDGLDDDRMYRSTDKGKYHNTLIGPRQETEANRFAANLLMPKSLIDRYRMQFDDDVEEMASLFQVSRHSMSIRLGIPFPN